MFNFFNKKKQEKQTEKMPYIAVIAKDTTDINIQSDVSDNAEIATRLYRLLLSAMAFLLIQSDMSVSQFVQQISNDLERIIIAASDEKEHEETDGNDD